MGAAIPASPGDFVDLLPLSATVDIDGRLSVAGCSLRELAARFGTPLYVVDTADVAGRAERLAGALARRRPNGRVHFAVKAFPCTPVIRLIHEHGLAAEVAGGGELHLALRAGVPARDIILDGNAKTDAEIEQALDAQVGRIVIDNLDDLSRLEARLVRQQRVLIRVRPEVDAPTHEAIATGHRTSKFGLSPDVVADVIARCRRSRYLDVEGVHVHIGSQIMDTSAYEEAIGVLAALGEFETYDLGGGLGVRYTYADDPPPPEAWVSALADAADRHLPASAAVLLEPGRSVVASAAVTLYSVVSVKGSEPTFVAVDGGMGDNLEVALYGQRFEAAVADRPIGGAEYELVGRHCESGDRISSRVRLNSPRPGDTIAVPGTGAYCFTMANNYNGAMRPPVVFCRDGATELVVRRETYADLVSREV